MKHRPIKFSFSTADTAVPGVLYSRYRLLLMFSLISLALGAATAAFRIYDGPLFSLTLFGMAIIFLIIAIKYKYTLESKGFCRITGEITYIKEKASPVGSILHTQSAKRTSYYHLKADDGTIFFLPAEKRSLDLPLNSLVAIYTPLDVYTYERNGVHHFSFIWGYEIIKE